MISQKLNVQRLGFQIPKQSFVHNVLNSPKTRFIACGTHARMTRTHHQNSDDSGGSIAWTTVWHYLLTTSLFTRPTGPLGKSCPWIPGWNHFQFPSRSDKRAIRLLRIGPWTRWNGDAALLLTSWVYLGWQRSHKWGVWQSQQDELLRQLVQKKCFWSRCWRAVH